MKVWTIDRDEMIDALSDARVALVADGRPLGSVEELADEILRHIYNVLPLDDRRVEGQHGAGGTAVKAEDAQSLDHLQQHWQRDDGTRVYTIAFDDGVWSAIPEADPTVALIARSAYELREVLRRDFSARRRDR